MPLLRSFRRHAVLGLSLAATACGSGGGPSAQKDASQSGDTGGPQESGGPREAESDARTGPDGAAADGSRGRDGASDAGIDRFIADANAPDAQPEASPDGRSSEAATADGPGLDGPELDAATVDGPTVDGPRVDASTADASSADGAKLDAATADASTGCTPAMGLPYSYACWPMPNPASAGLPNPASYTDQGNGTVKDNVTGLVWQQSVTSTQKYTWADALTYCQSLTLAGLTWRLPTRIELVSLIDFTRTSPALDTTAFPSTPGGAYTWAASPWVVSQIATKPQDSWIVNFFEGLTSNAADRTTPEFARCVSSSENGPLPKLYVSPAPGEEQDVETRLIWQQGDSGTTMAFSAAATYCASLGLNGHTWRVPSIKELATLVDEDPPLTMVSPAIDTTAFPTTAATTPYWSSTLFNGEAATTHDPWNINFEAGFTEYGQAAALVRCVR